MSLHGTYDDGNIFARILRGELPCHRIYETEDVLAFLDLFPQATGHTLVIPKRAKAQNLLEIDPGTLATLYQQSQFVARGLVEELKPDGLQLFQLNGAAAGQTVFHIHVHLIPRWDGAQLGIHGGTQGDAAELEALAKRLAARFA